MTPTRRIRTPARSTQTRSAALARCVEPLGADEFLEDYFEQRPLVVERDGSARFDDLLSESDVERLVGSGGLRHPAFRLVKAGETIAVSDYSTDVPWRPSAFTGAAEPAKVAAFFADGATIVVQGLHHWWEPIARFCRALERDLGHATQTNAYYTPRGSQGLPVHHDTHDVFVLQVAGRKRRRGRDVARSGDTPYRRAVGLISQSVLGLRRLTEALPQHHSVITITSASLYQKPLCDITVPKVNLFTGGDTTAMMASLARCDSLLRNPGWSLRTDIRGALKLAGLVLEQKPGRVRGIILISDLEETLRKGQEAAVPTLHGECVLLVPQITPAVARMPSLLDKRADTWRGRVGELGDVEVELANRLPQRFGQ
jgi:hypothetical protein